MNQVSANVAVYQVPMHRIFRNLDGCWPQDNMFYVTGGNSLRFWFRFMVSDRAIQEATAPADVIISNARVKYQYVKLTPEYDAMIRSSKLRLPYYDFQNLQSQVALSGTTQDLHFQFAIDPTQRLRSLIFGCQLITNPIGA